jgi:hypothetical protein
MKKQWVLVCVLAGAMAVAGTDLTAQHKAPNQQPVTAEVPKVPTGEVALGSVRLPRAVTADGKPLPAGTYQVRVTEQAPPDALGSTQELARWAEFLQKGQVRGREVVNIVPQAEIKMVAQDAPPAPGQSRVQVLHGGEYLRVWFNREGNHYLMHFPIGGATGE